MLFALLYDHNDQIIAAARACEQMSTGDRYWFESHPASIEPNQAFATAYREVRDQGLQQRLFSLGIDENVSSDLVTRDVEALDFGGTLYAPSRAA